MKLDNGIYTINLKDVGYNKLLSTGNVTKKLMITVDYATGKAVDKIKKAGGEVKVIMAKAKKEAKAEAAAKPVKPATEEPAPEAPAE
jgi:hypothetical protein